jgi:23S rRNA pseudouridine1911/1915/1917 synthase
VAGCWDGGDENAGDALVFEVTDAEAGERLDAALSKLGAGSRSQIQRWIDAGRVFVDGEIGRRSLRVALGMIVEATPPPALASEVLPEAIPLCILHEDEDLVVLDKPAGMVVHPAPGHHAGTLVNALLHHFAEGGRAGGPGLASIGGVLRPGIVHRLDRGTSGVMVVARNDGAHAGLASQFHDHDIERVYHAFVCALPGAEAGRVDQPIGRHPTDRKRMSVRTRSGRSAVTAWRVLERFPRSGVTWLEIRPETGRTHQIRVHLASVGLPIAGDPVYGRMRVAGLDRPALHAAVLGFLHPTRGQRMCFEAPLPSDLAALLARWRAGEASGAS